MNNLLLSPSTLKKTYYVNLYLGEPTYSNRKLFIPFYSSDYKTEKDAKIAAIKEFLRNNGNLDFYNYVTLSETIGMQIADKHEPYKSKSAIVKILAHKRVKMIEIIS